MPARRKSASDPKGPVAELQHNGNAIENDEVLRVKVRERERLCVQVRINQCTDEVSVREST